MKTPSYREVPFSIIEIRNKIESGDTNGYMFANFAVKYSDIENKTGEELEIFYSNVFAGYDTLRNLEVRPVGAVYDGRLILQIAGNAAEILKT